MTYEVPTCWTELCVEREVVGTEDYTITFDINSRSDIEVRNPNKASKTFFRVVTEPVGEEAVKPEIWASDDCRNELGRVRDDLDLATVYWTGYSSIIIISQETLNMEVIDNFEEMYNRCRAQDGLPPESRMSTSAPLSISTTAQMTAVTVDRILSFTALINADTVRKRDVMRLYRAGKLMPDVEYFHWFKIYEILSDSGLGIIRKVNNQFVTSIPGIDPDYLFYYPQLDRHDRTQQSRAQAYLNQTHITGDYLSHLRPLIEHYIENF